MNCLSNLLLMLISKIMAFNKVRKIGKLGALFFWILLKVCHNEVMRISADAIILWSYCFLANFSPACTCLQVIIDFSRNNGIVIDFFQGHTLNKLLKCKLDFIC